MQLTAAKHAMAELAASWKGKRHTWDIASRVDYCTQPLVSADIAPLHECSSMLRIDRAHLSIANTVMSR